jgi:acetyl-CoA acetyltransferase
MSRFAKFMEARAHDRAFQKRCMFAPEVTVSKKKTKLVEEDEGWTPTTAEGLAKLKAVRPGGCLSYGAKTFPADGNCGIIVTTRDRAKPMFMPAASAPAAEMALATAGLKVDDVKAVKTHNPFAINDIAFARKTGHDRMKMNNYGSSLIYGHPQGPTAGRVLIEMQASSGTGNSLFWIAAPFRSFPKARSFPLTHHLESRMVQVRRGISYLTR